MKKTIFFLLSMLMCLSFCLNVNAQGNELTLQANQNEKGDLIIEASGTKKDEFLENMVSTSTTNKGLLFSAYNGSWQGCIRNCNDKNDAIVVTDGKAIIKKEVLINAGFVDGDYIVGYSNFSYTTNVSLSLNKQVTIKKPNFVYILGSMMEPKVGESTLTNQNIKVRAFYDTTENNGFISQVSVDISDYNFDEPCFNYYWAEKEYVANSSDYNYVSTSDSTFMEGKTYYLVVECFYLKGEDDGSTISMNHVETSNFKTYINFIESKKMNRESKNTIYLNKTASIQFVFELTAKEPVTPEFKISETENFGDSLNIKIVDSVKKVSSSILNEEDYYTPYSFNIYLQSYGKSLDSFEDWTKDDVALIKKNLNNYIFGEEFYFELYQIRSGNSIATRATGEETLEEINVPIAINVELPSNLINNDNNINREYKIARVHNGNFDMLDATLDSDNTLTFSTNKFSTFAIVYKDTEKKETNVPTSKIVTCEDTNGQIGRAHV